MSVMKRVAVLGSTGSIGRQTLEVIRALPHRLQVVGLAGGSNANLFRRQLDEFRPKLACFQDAAALPPDAGYDLLGLDDIARHPDVDTVVVAVSGSAGLSPTLAAVKAGKDVALANKESLVSAGEIITAEAERNNARILPIDSEHSAIWQCLRGEKEPPARLLLTASGGAFLGYSADRLKQVTPEQALNHPSWRMGDKVTIDSATLMNKGLEVIEARWLFGIPIDDIKVVIHPQSTVHSMVEFADGSVKAQLSPPDMRLPIQYALSYPEHLPNPQLPSLDWDSGMTLSFQPPDPDAFPCLDLAVEAGRQGGTCPAVLCAADEIAVSLFLSHSIGFTDIAAIVRLVLEEHKPTPQPTLEDIAHPPAHPGGHRSGRPLGEG